MNIRFLYFEGCPNQEKALNLLREVIKSKGIDENIEIIDVKSENETKRYKFLGSPSIQINRKDIEKERRNDQPLFGCRVYFYNGKYQGVPPKKLIEKAIDETLNA
ncbi:MAG: DF family (seleno)protein [Candidatus Helarchaeota archaeon]